MVMALDIATELAVKNALRDLKRDFKKIRKADSEIKNKIIEDKKKIEDKKENL